MANPKNKRVKVDHSEFRSSYGTDAKGRGCWVFSVTKNANVDDMFFDSEWRTVAQSAKAASEFFGGVEVVFAQP